MFDDSILLTAWNSQLARAASKQHSHPMACHTFAKHTGCETGLYKGS